ncbi:phage holin family protein [Promicromonospora kroppenstedtii]|uniref:Phage holin family protein n=1 Tax=Promicromonospora kroppenstedtii TaxID=440482 RepID=A0ABW7XP82_9MICO
MSHRGTSHPDHSQTDHRQTDPRHTDQSVGSLVGEISRDVSTLMRQEVALAKAEVADSAKRAGKGVGMFGGAGVAGHMVLVFLSLALWWALGTLVGGGWSALLVAAVWAVIAGVLALRGRAELRAVEGLPRTTESVRKIPDALHGHDGLHGADGSHGTEAVHGREKNS